MMNCWWVLEQLHSSTQVLSQPLCSLDAEGRLWLDAAAADNTNSTSLVLPSRERIMLESTLGPRAASSIATTDALSIVG